MELIYLRIFDTRTNHILSFTNRDINFNGKHHFYLNNKTGKIEYKKNKTYVADLYGKHISVTGLIGGNGVGKTTFLKFLQYLIAKLEGLETSHSYIYDSWEWMAIVNLEDGLNITYGYEYPIKNETNTDELYSINISPFVFQPITFDEFIIEPNKILSSSIYYSPHLELEEPNFDTPDYVNVSSDFILYHESRNKEDSDQNISQMIDFRRNEIKRQIAFMQFAELKQNEEIQFYKEFNRETINIEFYQFIKKFTTDPKYIDFEDINIYKEIDSKFLRISNDLNYNIRRKKSGTDAELAKLWFYKRLFEILFYNVEYRGEINIDPSNYRLKITNNFQMNSETIFKDFENYFSSQLVINSTQLTLFIVEIDQVFESELIYTEDNKSFNCSLEAAKKLMSIENKILDLFPYSSKLPLFNIDWQGMSTGEKAYLNLFSRLHYGLTLLNDHIIVKKSKKIYFLIDEPSTGFHPQWQKEYLNKLLNFLEIRHAGEKHLVISSHSPFLVSDLQKEDVVALSKNNKSMLSKENTFGANIQDLLADNFFLQNGFIGNFAKNKIDELIEILTNDDELIKENIDKVQNLITIIGEPLIKDRLQEIFDSKFKTRNDIELEIARLQNLLREKEL